MDTKDLLTIGEVARRSGFPQSALRYYEREGLVRTTRTSGGQRRYERSVLRRLAFIRAARTVGVGLDEVRDGLDQLPDGPHPEPGRLDPAVPVVARPAGRADRGAGGAARRPGLLHRVRLPVAAALPAVQRRRPDGGRRTGCPAAAPDAAPHPGRGRLTPTRPPDVRLDVRRRPARPGYRAGVVDSLDRWLALEGLDNVRDVGGLPLRDGGRTRPGVLLRSASLHYVTPADVEHLVDVLGLKLVLDLRTRREIDRDGPTAVARAGVETVWLSFLAEDGRAAAGGGRRHRPDAAQLPRLPVASAARTWSRRSAGWPPPTPVRRWCTARRARTGPGCWWRWCWTRSACSARRAGRLRALRRAGAGAVPALDHARRGSRCPPTSPRTCRGPR